jgi:H+-translocating diphosphatase
VGDNVGDVAGMSADLFGSLAESTCAALLLSSDSLLSKGDLSMNNQSYPLVVVAFGILACVATNYVGLYLSRIKAKGEVETTLKQQLVLSTLLLTPALYLAAILCFPPEFSVGGMSSTRLEPFLCSLGGLWAGLLIGWFT